jgi:hypothetical protein
MRGGGGHKKFAFSLVEGQKSFQSLFFPFTNTLLPINNDHSLTAGLYNAIHTMQVLNILI